MRTLIPIVLLAALAYTGWFYLQSWTDTPLRERLLLTDTGTLREISVTEAKRSYRMFRSGEGGWVVKRDAIELYDQSDAVKNLVSLLRDLRTDSVMYRFPEAPGPDLTLTGRGDRLEVLSFRFPAGSPPLVRVGATGDVFALPPEVRSPLRRMLRFETYRGKTTLAAEPGDVDSIKVSYHDSLLWRVPQAEVLRLSKTFIAPASAPDAPPPYADYFDEVMDRERYFATLTLFAVADSLRIEVFRDSQWVRPYVIVGEDFPRRYFALDSLR